MKFAMIPINRRYNDKNERVVRRILISYTSKRQGIYKGTKLIDKDPYFNDPKSSQKYIFEDNCFYLVSDGYSDPVQGTLLKIKRNYEFDAGLLYETAIEFQAADLQEAVEMFRNRVEVH